MNSFGFFSLVAGALQLSIPPYALRLIRRFGVQRVGWFLVIAFACLGLLHLLEPFRMLKASAASAMTVDGIYAMGAILLLIGMAHVETLISAKLQALRDEKALHDRLNAQLKQSTAALAAANETLTQEMARRAQKEKALEESEAQYCSLFIQNPQPMWILDLRSLRFLAVNRTALALYGFAEQEFMTLGLADLLSPDDAAGFLQNVAKPCFGVEARGRWRLRRNDGTLLQAQITAIDLRYANCPARLILATDMSAQQQEQFEALEQHRMELIGKVAGGVGHHFNNILTVISGHTEMLIKAAPEKEMAAQLNQIVAAVHRGTCLTRQLLAAGGQQMLNVAPVDLNDCLERLNPIFVRSLGNSITSQSALGLGLPPVMADKRALENMIISLVLNARDAMSGRGTLRLSTRVARLSEADTRRRNGARAGEFVRLSVSDTGRGMAPEVQARLFEPFFTTKEIGQAAGLGLASAYGCAKQHSGWIECISEVGKGTEIQVFLPCASPSSSIVQTRVSAAKPLARETVLFVEPEDRARVLGRFFLNRHGYSVIEADSASIAFKLWESKQAKVDLLLTEILLPGGASGLQLAEQLRAAKPGLKVMYTCDPETSEPSLTEKPAVIAKPFTAEGLIKKIEQYLAAS